MRRPERHARRDVHRLARYLTGESPPAERAEIEARLAVDEKLARLLDELRRIWDAAEEATSEVDVEAMRERFGRRVREGRAGKVKRLPSAVAPARPTALRPGRPSRRTSAWPLLLLAFAVVALVGGGVAWLLRPAAAPEGPTSKVFATKPGQFATVRLADGTDVRLSVDSRLTVPEGRSRVVKLEGQAFFDVAPDSARPFLVRAGGAVAEALGTAFDVRAYPSEAGARVAVAEGRVALRTTAEEADPLVLEPHHLARVEGGRTSVVRDAAEVERLTAWRAGRLVFEGAAFSEVAGELERWYGLEVALEGPVGGRLTASFADESLDQILDVVALALQLDYRRESHRVVFYPDRSASPTATSP